MNPNGVVSYNVTLSGVNLANNQPIDMASISAIVDETSYTVAHSSIPYSIYTAIVFASTSAGDSTMETVTEQTPEDGNFTKYAMRSFQLPHFFSSFSRGRTSSECHWQSADCQLGHSLHT